jgi:GGDEF domain-containing protein
VLPPTPGLPGPADPPAVIRSVGDAVEGARRARRPVTLVMIEVDAQGEADAAMARLLGQVRRVVRRTDGVWRFGEQSIAIMLMDADGPSAEPALARMRLRLREDRHLTLRMGRAAAAPGIDAESLLDLARADMREVMHA